MLLRCLLPLLLLMPLPALGAPAPPAQVDTWAFDRQPVSAETLASIAGGSRVDAVNARGLADAEATSVLQYMGRSASLAMDNWWAQTGAALIDNNLLAR